MQFSCLSAVLTVDDNSELLTEPRLMACFQDNLSKSAWALVTERLDHSGF